MRVEGMPLSKLQVQLLSADQADCSVRHHHIRAVNLWAMLAARQARVEDIRLLPSID